MNEKFYNPQPRTHLDLSIKGNKPIIACVADRFGKFGDPFGEKFPQGFEELGNKRRVQYGIPALNLPNKEDLQTQSTLSTISAIDGTNKYSIGYIMCTGLVVSGIDSETKKPISFISHQYPGSFLKDEKEEFTAGLDKQLSQMKARSIPGTIDALIVGGSYIDRDKRGGEYLESLKLLGGEIKKSLGFEPTVVNGPSAGPQHQYNGRDDIYFDNDERRLYFIRHEINKEVPDFPPSDAEKVKGNFEK